MRLRARDAQLPQTSPSIPAVEGLFSDSLIVMFVLRFLYISFFPSLGATPIPNFDTGSPVAPIGAFRIFFFYFIPFFCFHVDYLLSSGK